MAGWMINCKEYTTLVSIQMDRKLSFAEKIAVRVHQLLCPPCRHTKDQFSTMRQVCRWIPEDQAPAGHHDEDLPEEICQRIKSAIKNLPVRSS